MSASSHAGRLLIASDFSTKDLERFWGHVEKKDDHECWEWKSSRNDWGYGRFAFNGRRYQFAHRVSVALMQPLPAGVVVDHLCRNRGCVNPSHLEIVTVAEKKVIAHRARRIAPPRFEPDYLRVAKEETRG